MDNLIHDFIIWLQLHLSAESLTLITFLICSIAILLLLKFYGEMGLYVYNALALVVANIQVLRLTLFENFTTPVALGTVVFTTTFFVNDLISEHYGAKSAMKNVMLGFWVQILMVVWMILTLGHPLVPIDTTTDQSIIFAQKSHDSMMQLFTPSLRILFASLIAYWCSQWLDVFIFSRLKRATNGNFLWLRQNISMFLAGFLDTLIFSALAWRWLSDIPFSWIDLFMTFILSAQIIRIFLNLAATPLMYLSYRLLKNKMVVAAEL